jgi:hypothetical protein
MTNYEKVENIISLMTSYERTLDSNGYFNENKPNSNWYVAIQLLKGDSLLKHQVIRKLSFLTIKDCFNNNNNVCIPKILQTKYINGDYMWKFIGNKTISVNSKWGNVKQLFMVFLDNDFSSKTRTFDLTNPEHCVDLIHRLDSFFDSLLYNILNE